MPAKKGFTGTRLNYAGGEPKSVLAQDTGGRLNNGLNPRSVLRPAGPWPAAKENNKGVRYEFLVLSD